MRSDNPVFRILILCIVLILASCSVEKNRKLLRVFFDGVPDGNGKMAEGRRVQEPGNTAVKTETILAPASSHPDFIKKNCSKCHDRSRGNFLVTSKKDICFTCHKQEAFTGKYVHGPVAVRACNTCHEPHQSSHRKLLLETGKELCALCHRTPVTGVSIPCKGDNCLGCHDPHIADNPYFLKGDTH